MLMFQPTPPRSQVFLRYFHMDKLLAQLKKEANALRFVRKVVRGFIARYHYRSLLAALAEQHSAVAAFIQLCEVCSWETVATSSKARRKEEKKKLTTSHQVAVDKD